MVGLSERVSGKKAFWGVFLFLGGIGLLVYWLIYPWLIYYAGLVCAAWLVVVNFYLSGLLVILLCVYCGVIFVRLAFCWKKMDRRGRLRRFGFFLFAMGILGVGIYNHGRWQSRYLYGTKSRISKNINVCEIKEWMAELDISPEKALRVDVEQAPAFMKRLKPWRVFVSEYRNDSGESFREARIQWMSIGVLELNVGCEGETPEWVRNKGVVLGPGVYLYHLEK